MDADDYRKERLLRDVEDAEAHAHTVAGTGWQPEYEGMLAHVPGSGREPVTMVTYDPQKQKVLVQQSAWISAELLTPMKGNNDQC